MLASPALLNEKRIKQVREWWARSILARALVLALGCTAFGSAVALAFGVRGSGRTTNELAAYPFIDLWIRWDAGWYQAISTTGYDFSPIQQSAVAFFPLYPLLMRAVSWFGVNSFVSGILLTAAAGVVAAILFNRWARDRAGEAAASRATWLLLLWPFAFYLYGAVYADALFLALVIGAFLLLERGAVGSATLLGALATATRPVAPAVVLGLLARQIERRLRANERLRLVDALPLLSGLGLAAYMTYLSVRFGDPLAFATTQTGWQQTGARSVLKLRLLDDPQFPLNLPLPVLHAALAVGLLALAVPTVRRLGWGYGLYSAAVMGVPLVASRDFIGLGRYGLATFPCFLTLAMLLEARPVARRVWFAVSIALLALMLSRFALGRYVS